MSWLLYFEQGLFDQAPRVLTGKIRIMDQVHCSVEIVFFLSRRSNQPKTMLCCGNLSAAAVCESDFLTNKYHDIRNPTVTRAPRDGKIKSVVGKLEGRVCFTRFSDSGDVFHYVEIAHKEGAVAVLGTAKPPDNTDSMLPFIELESEVARAITNGRRPKVKFQLLDEVSTDSAALRGSDIGHSRADGSSEATYLDEKTVVVAIGEQLRASTDANPIEQHLNGAILDGEALIGIEVSHAKSDDSSNAASWTTRPLSWRLVRNRVDRLTQIRVKKKESRISELVQDTVSTVAEAVQGFKDIIFRRAGKIRRITAGLEPHPGSPTKVRIELFLEAKKV